MPKKWYNYFVSTGTSNETGAAEEASTTSGSAARTVADIAASVGEPPKFDTPVTNPHSFDEIYAAAEIQPPPHGFTIFKIAEMLQSEHIRSLPAGVKKSSILVALDASGVKVQEIIEDAVRRDRALDTFERLQQKALDELEASKNEDNRRIQEEIDRIVAEHRARIQANSAEVAGAKEKFYSWRVQKQQEEQRISEAVSYFVTENPITASPPPAVPPSTPRGRD